MFVKRNTDEDYTDTFKSVYKKITSEFGYKARVTDIWPLLCSAYNLKEFEILNLLNYNNGSFEAYMIDRMIDWRKGKEVDFSEIYEVILDLGDFTESEKLKFENGNIEETLWAIYSAIFDPTIEL